MPAKDVYHDNVKNALIKDGWTITDDPLVLTWGPKDLFVDLGAERLLGAERGGRRIAVEVKSFLGPSEVDDLERALGQFVLYHEVLQRVQPDRELFLAIRCAVFEDFFQEPLGKLLLDTKRLQLLVFDPEAEVLLQWVT